MIYVFFSFYFISFYFWKYSFIIFFSIRTFIFVNFLIHYFTKIPTADVRNFFSQYQTFSIFQLLNITAEKLALIKSIMTFQRYIEASRQLGEPAVSQRAKKNQIKAVKETSCAFMSESNLHIKLIHRRSCHFTNTSPLERISIKN